MWVATEFFKKHHSGLVLRWQETLDIAPSLRNHLQAAEEQKWDILTSSLINE